MKVKLREDGYAKDLLYYFYNSGSISVSVTDCGYAELYISSDFITAKELKEVGSYLIELSDYIYDDGGEEE